MTRPNRLTAAEVQAWLEDSPPEIGMLAKAARRLVHDALPDTTETPNRGGNAIGFGANQYGADGWGIGTIGVAQGWVSIGLMRGAHLPDPGGIVEGSGRNVRHVKVHSLAELDARAEAIRTLLRTAAGQATERDDETGGERASRT